MEKKKDFISSIDNAITLLFAISEQPNQSIRELSTVVGISKSTLHRTLQTLEYRGLVKQDRETKTYSLGYSVLELSVSLKEHLEINHLAYPYMEKLRDELGETVQLAVRHNESILIVEAIEGKNLMRMFSHPGETHSLTYGNFGKVFLSELSKAEVKDTIGRYPLKKYGANSIVDPDEYVNELGKVRAEGVAIGIDDPIDGAFSVAAPIYNWRKQIIASFALVGAKTPSNMAKLEEIKTMFKTVSQQVSEKLMFRDSQ